MARAPRYRQRFAEVPLGAADPVWVDDEDFAIDRHVHRSTSADLSEVVDEVMSRRLSRDRPMWEMWIADRLGDGRIGVVGKAHHAMVDGLAAVELATLLLDPTPEPPAPEADGWSPAAPPGAFALFAGGLANRAAPAGRRRLASAAGRPAPAAGAAHAGARARGVAGARRRGPPGRRPAAVRAADVAAPPPRDGAPAARRAEGRSSRRWARP